MIPSLALTSLIGLFALIGLALAALIVRADPKRWDNRVFAAMCAIDSITAGFRLSQLLDGQQLTDHSVLRVCLIGSIWIAFFTAEFAYSYPFNRRLPASGRAIALAATSGATVLTILPSTHDWFAHNATLYYFFPYFGVTLYYLGRNLRRVTGDAASIGIPIVMLSVAFRWVTAMFTFMIAKQIGPEAFDAALLFDATGAMFLSYTLLAYALLRYHLFRVRGLVAEAVLHGGGVIATVALLCLCVELVLSRVSGPVTMRALLVAIALVPSGIIAIGKFLLPKIEERILAPINPRRRLMKGVLEDLVHQTSGKVDSKDVIAVTLNAAVQISDCGDARFLRGPAFQRDPRDVTTGDEALGDALAKHLAAMKTDHLHRPAAQGLDAATIADLDKTGAELIVPVRRANALFGAIAVKGGEVDRDTVLTAVALADHLALKLENYDLFAQMLRLQTELDEKSRLAALGSFAAAIAHDIRTPLTSVQMNVQILRGKAKLPPDDMEYFDIALEELKRLNLHITELLDYAKPVMVKKSAIDLRELADDAAKGLEPILSDRKLTLAREYSEVPPVLADPSRIRQVLLNLLENAAQATSQGGAITLRARSDDGHIALDVADNGRGIEAENLAKIFEPFFTTRADGTGLGLAIAQKLVRAHGGEIRVRSQPGLGSTFTVLLPPA